MTESSIITRTLYNDHRAYNELSNVQIRKVVDGKIQKIIRAISITVEREPQCMFLMGAQPVEKNPYPIAGHILINEEEDIGNRFDILLYAKNEEGDVAKMWILGVEITDQDKRDPINYTFVAESIIPWKMEVPND